MAQGEGVMSQVPSEDRRKLILVFSGPNVAENGQAPQRTIDALEFFARKYYKWKLEESHCVPLDTPVRVGDEAKK
jgi:hypothetical protein